MKIILFSMPAMVPFSSSVSLLGLIRNKVTDAFQKLLDYFDNFDLHISGLPRNVGLTLFRAVDS